jgi:hypothetical protein
MTKGWPEVVGPGSALVASGAPSVQRNRTAAILDRVTTIASPLTQTQSI